jgi:hypothetical protein
VSNTAAVISCSLVAAACFATSGSLKHVSAAQVPDAQSMRFGAVRRFATASLTHRLWVGAFAFDIAGVVLQALALHAGALAVVQPLMIAALPLALVGRAQFRNHHMNRTDVAWALVLSAALAGFLSIALSNGGGGAHQRVDRSPAIIAGAVGVIIATGCIELGRRHRSPRRVAALVGVAVGLVYATTAALLKALTDIIAHDWVSVLWSWQTYVAVILGASGLLLGQLSFQAGPISASLAATATVDPLASIVIGVVVFDETLGVGPGHGAVLAVLLLVLAGAAIRLARPAAESIVKL